MSDKIKNLLDKINFPKSMYDDFNNTSISRIVVIDKEKQWDIYINNNTNFRYEVINCFISCLKEYTKNNYKYNLYINVNEIDYKLLNEYYKNILILTNNNNFYYNLFGDRLVNDNETYYIEVYNKSEIDILNNKLSFINESLKNYGFSELEYRINEEKANEIKNSIKNDYNNVSYNEVKNNNSSNTSTSIYNKPYEKKTYRKKANLFDKVEGRITPLSAISYEMNDVNVEVQIFGISPSTKKGFNSLTLKVTDFKSSMYVRIFFNSEEEYEESLAKFKEGMYLRINGYVKNNTFYNDFVLNARTIEFIDKKEEIKMDNSETKRVELHAHTMMSQMDGVVDVKNLIKRAVLWGHKAIAITDHNGIPTFPEAFHHKDEIKILYGVELSMIDDDIDLVLRPDDSVLKENTYVVFDFETTGFNAGGGDSIIEIGAVKLKDGEIIDRFDRLINPGVKLQPHIVKLTNITDAMLEDCPTEEEAIKEFIDWYGTCPMVAHNAKFDASFLEMCYQKYNLGEYKNVLFDTLQLSRALDSEASRHSLSALVKRYDIVWNEDAHHRADYDAEGTALIFQKMIDKLNAKQIFKISEVGDLVSKEDIHKIGELFHINILVKNQVGLKNLFKIVSLANTKYLYKTPRILRSEINKLREGLLIGSSCANGEIFRQARSKSEEELGDLMNFYDYIEIQPPDTYSYLIDLDDFKNNEEVILNIEKIMEVAESKNKLIVATGDVHQLDKEDTIYRKIIVNQKVEIIIQKKREYLHTLKKIC